MAVNTPLNIQFSRFFNFSSSKEPIVQSILSFYLVLQSNTFHSLAATAIILVSAFSGSEVQPSAILLNSFRDITYSSQSGGAISLINCKTLSIQSNTFNSVSPKDDHYVYTGGALFIDTLSEQISVLNNSFTLCAATTGGAIRWTNSKPSFAHNSFSLN